MSFFVMGLSTTFLLQAAPSAAPIDLFCMGRGDRFVTTQIQVRKADGTIANQTKNDRIPFDDAVRVKIAGDSGEALIPDAMLGNDNARGWHEMKKLVFAPSLITGKIYFDWLFSPVMTLNLATGTLRISGSLANFSGTCSPYTGQVAPRSRRYVPPSAMAAPLTSGMDPRAAARAKAAQVQQQGSGQLATLKFDVFNSGTLPIASINSVTSGTVGTNWITQKAIDPSTFRNFTFNNAQCSRNVKVMFSSGASITRPINFCGKKRLYVSNTDLWAE
jgi:hypothetical protein